jgi:predicted signal transduction protein with EAL and GGDEF domain
MIVSASMGMAIYPDDADDSIKLLRIADQRMYALKQRLEFSPKGVKSAGVDSTTTIAIAGGQQ